MAESGSPHPAFIDTRRFCAGEILGRGRVSLYWRSWLPVDDPTAVVVMAHGGLEHGGRYQHVANRFATAGLATFAIDFRGHGRSGGRPGQIERMAHRVDDLDRIVQYACGRHAGTPLFLLGHSLGTMVTLGYIINRYTTVSGVVLSGTGIDVSGISGFQAIVARILSEMVPNLGLIRLDSAGISCDPAVVERYDTDPLVFRGKVPVRTAAELIASANRVRSSLDSITLPLLIVHGGADIVASPAGAQMIFDRASSIDKKLTIYDGLYHEILNEPEKDDVISDVVEWISARSTP